MKLDEELVRILGVVFGDDGATTSTRAAMLGPQPTLRGSRVLLHLLDLALLLHEKLELHVDLHDRLEILLRVLVQGTRTVDLTVQNQLIGKLEELDEAHLRLGRPLNRANTERTVGFLEPLQLIGYLVSHGAQLGQDHCLGRELLLWTYLDSHR